ncbi:hypothetical protein RI367_001387 [Sorochytrium milnesiophthora]
MLTSALPLLLLLAASASSVRASPVPEHHTPAGIKQLVVFGDSLSDVGNGSWPHSNFTNPPSPPYFKGHYSNGPIWVEYLSQLLGAASTSYARGGATSVNAPDDQPPRPIPSVADQLGEFVHDFPTLPPACSSLYVVWIGANDLFYKSSNLSTAAQVGTLLAAPALVGGYIAQDMGRLADAVPGGAHVVVLTVPTVERVPAWAGVLAPAERALLGYVTRDTNARLAADLQEAAKRASPYARHRSVTLVDSYAMFDDLITNPQLYGFSNSTGQCLATDPVTGAPGAQCANPDEYVFWDGYHPTTKAHKVLADKIHASLQEQVLDKLKC